MDTIEAAGTIPWRRGADGLEVALVHRPRYDDWSWPKGKLEPGEPWVVAAARETAEETGLHVRIGMPLPDTSYSLVDAEGVAATKHVRYWSAQVVGGEGRLEHEIDELSWLPVDAAEERLDYPHDRVQLKAVRRADAAGTLGTRPFAIVRHAIALPRGQWHKSDLARPLLAVGVEQARHVGNVLAAYGITVLESSPAERCVATLEPHARRHGLTIKTRNRFSEEGFDSLGKRPLRRSVTRLFETDSASALCSHGPVLPAILKTVAKRLAPGRELAEGTKAVLDGALKSGLDKGEVLVLHLVGSGEKAKIVAAERVSPIPAH